MKKFRTEPSTFPERSRDRQTSRHPAFHRLSRERLTVTIDLRPSVFCVREANGLELIALVEHRNDTGPVEIDLNISNFRNELLLDGTDIFDQRTWQKILTKITVPSEKSIPKSPLAEYEDDQSTEG